MERLSVGTLSRTSTMRLLAISSFVALVLASSGDAVQLPTVARPFKPSDIVGKYTRFLALPGAETFCPKTIEHKSYSKNPNDTSSYVIPHQEVLHDGVKCTSDSYTVVGNAEDVSKAEQFGEVVKKDTAGTSKAVLDKVLSGTDSMLGYELGPRMCGKAVGLSKDTAYTFIHEHDRDIELIPNALVLQKGARYMLVLSTKDGKGIGCAYNNEAAPTDATPAPLSAASSSDGPSPSSTSAKNDTSDSGSGCFPATASVTLETGEFKNMDELMVGDRVHVGGNRFSDVFAFTHKSPSVTSVFIEITAASGEVISLSPGHYLYVNSQLVAANSVSTGDLIELASGRSSPVVSTRIVLRRGLFNPQTVDGSIVVNGIRASTYTTAVHPVLAHAALSPFRALYDLFRCAPLSLAYGAGSLQSLLPRGGSISA